jgi:N-acetylglucosamine-6-phosphate deacetylase
MPTIFNHGTILTPIKTLENSTVVVSDDGLIEYVGCTGKPPNVDGEKIDIRGRILAPGFIDIHIHGGFGINLSQMEGLVEGVKIYSKCVVKNGVTGYLSTIAAPKHSDLVKLIQAYVSLSTDDIFGAELLGLHLEGPYLNNNKKKGAFEPSWLREPSLEEVQEYIKVSKGLICQMTVDPELSGANEVASFLRRSGVIVALGHTNSNYELATKALRGNFTHVTHTFNAQKGFNHREPGAIGAILTSDHVTAELIADNVHVDIGAMKVLLRCVGPDRIVLVTDAMPGAGLGEGVYDLVGQSITVKGNKATLKNGTLAGSIATMDQCIKNMVIGVGVSLPQAIQMASLNAARSMGFANQLGSITPGRIANLVLIDENINIYLTMVRGKIVHNNL